MIVHDYANNSPTQATGEFQLSHKLVTSRTFTHSRSDTATHELAMNFSISGGLDGLVTVSESMTVTESRSSTVTYGDENTHSEEKEMQTTEHFDVPPGKHYLYTLRIYNGTVSVPYTAHMVFKPNVHSRRDYEFDIHGTYTGVNAYKAEIVVTDITDKPQGVEVKRQPVSRAAMAAH
jgi:hypothetical protein